MKYLKMIEFLAGELARTEELVKNQSVINAKLEHMTTEKDHWKEEALEYRNEIEPKWWDERKQYEDKIKSLNDKYSKSWANEIAYHHLKKVYDEDKSYYENKIAKLQVEVNHLKHNK